MTTIRIKGDPHPYDVKDRECIGRPCLNLHPVSIRGATTSGSRFVGYRYCCARRDYHGCPVPIPPFDQALAQERRQEGYRAVR